MLDDTSSCGCCLQHRTYTPAKNISHSADAFGVDALGFRAMAEGGSSASARTALMMQKMQLANEIGLARANPKALRPLHTQRASEADVVG